MSWLVRKINRAKWPDKDFDRLHIEDVDADTITNGCLRTFSNTLSTWEITSLEDVNEAVLALATSFSSIDKIDIVILEKDDLVKNGLHLENTSGETHIKDLVNSHWDICNLTYKSLGDFTKLVLNSFQNERVTRISAKNLKNILLTAIESGRLDKSLLHVNLQNKLSS